MLGLITLLILLKWRAQGTTSIFRLAILNHLVEIVYDYLLLVLGSAGQWLVRHRILTIINQVIGCGLCRIQLLLCVQKVTQLWVLLVGTIPLTLLPVMCAVVFFIIYDCTCLLIHLWVHFLISLKLIERPFVLVVKVPRWLHNGVPHSFLDGILRLHPLGYEVRQLIRSLVRSLYLGLGVCYLSSLSLSLLFLKLQLDLLLLLVFLFYFFLSVLRADSLFYVYITQCHQQLIIPLLLAHQCLVLSLCNLLLT